MTPPPPASAERLRAGVAAPAPLRLPPAPRRVSGPARRTRAAERPVTGFGAVVIRLIDHPWLERLVRGRAWIAIVAAALFGIVAMQVALLRLGAQVGNQTTAVNAMIQRNEAMVSTIGEIEASRGLGTQPSSLGMLYPPPGAVTYLQPSPGDALRAAARMQPPSAAAGAAAVAHPPRATTSSEASTTHSSAAGTTAGTATGATGAAGTGVAGASVAADTPTSTASTTSGTVAATSATSTTTTTPPSRTDTTAGTTATGTPPPTTAAGGAAATTDAGGTSAATTGANSGASVAPAATSTGG